MFLLWEKSLKTIEKAEIPTHLSSENWTPREMKKKKQRNVDFEISYAIKNLKS